MLQDTFYTVLLNQLQDEQTLAVQIQFNKSHPIFEGHFPGNPVVPGVCMLQIIKEILAQHLNKNLRLTNLSNVKFINMVDPNKNDIVNISIHIDKIQEDGVKVNSTITADDITFLKVSNARYI